MSDEELTQSIDIGLTPDLYNSLGMDILASVEDALADMNVSIDFAGLSEVVMARPLATADVVGAGFVLDEGLLHVEMPDIQTQWEPARPEAAAVPEPVFEPAPEPAPAPIPEEEPIIPVAQPEKIMDIEFATVLKAPRVPGLEPEVPVVPTLELRAETRPVMADEDQSRKRRFRRVRIIILLIIFFFIEMLVVAYLASTGAINAGGGLFSLFSCHILPLAPTLPFL